jgi:hypothetical protein
MQNLLTANKNAIKAKAFTAAAAVIVSIILPQIFHAAGIASGLGPAVGAAFLPMHLPVLIAGLIAGPLAGFAVGAVSPVLSFAISGMPAAFMLPFMTVELACYGAACGLFKKIKVPVIVKLLAAQVFGRLVRAAVILIAVYGFGTRSVTAADTYNIVINGLPGILLQWAVVPLLIYRVEGLKKNYE